MVHQYRYNRSGELAYLPCLSRFIGALDKREMEILHATRKGKIQILFRINVTYILFSLPRYNQLGIKLGIVLNIHIMDGTSLSLLVDSHVSVFVLLTSNC